MCRRTPPNPRPSPSPRPPLAPPRRRRARTRSARRGRRRREPRDELTADRRRRRRQTRVSADLPTGPDQTRFVARPEPRTPARRRVRGSAHPSGCPRVHAKRAAHRLDGVSAPVQICSKFILVFQGFRGCGCLTPSVLSDAWLLRFRCSRPGSMAWPEIVASWINSKPNGWSGSGSTTVRTNGRPTGT